MLYTTFNVKNNDYKCRLGAKACCDLEKKLGSNPLNIFMDIANSGKMPNVDTMLQIIFYSMQQYQHGVTFDKVCEIYDDFIDEGHTVTDLIPLIMEIFKVSGFFKEEVEKN